MSKQSKDVPGPELPGASVDAGGGAGTAAPGTADPRHTCRDGGRLVPMSGWLPDSPLDRDVGALFGLVGCNQLRCTRCGDAVRWYDASSVPPGDRRMGAELVAVADPQADGLLVSDAACRTYACSCAIRQVYTATPVDGDYGLDPRVSEPGPWRCAGHPLPTLPWRIGGFVISRWDDGADALVAAHLGGGVPQPLPFAGTELERVAGAWLVHLALQPAEARWRDAIAQALVRRSHWQAPTTIAALLTMAMLPDQAIARQGVVDLAGDAAAASWAVDVAASRLSSVVDALGVFGADDDAPPELRATALDLARSAWFAGAPCRTLPHSLVRAGVRWLLDDAAAAAAAQPKAYDHVLWALQRRAES